eukprot:CAMPEP_0178994970 /NCGR_PEP_ID=MMETSP0795-20121207/7583_1 /TAXON_ID=88552 /ORGANISM="Amoebophrya sp., Strain Ameob2" /LENGTH=62 /DNA_ID=CAMNT_0020687257 /DNA_START=281 /DNA_END=469 /DNA_ORIENTATION=+
MYYLCLTGSPIEDYPDLDASGGFPWETRKALLDELETISGEVYSSGLSAVFGQLVAKGAPSG